MTDQEKPHTLLANEVAYFCERLAQYTALDADALMLEAEDLIAHEWRSDRAAVILDGMRAGIAQAQEAALGARVLTIWYDDNSGRATFSWGADEAPGPGLVGAVNNAVRCALTPNGHEEALAALAKMGQECDLREAD